MGMLFAWNNQQLLRYPESHASEKLALANKQYQYIHTHNTIMHHLSPPSETWEFSLMQYMYYLYTFISSILTLCLQHSNNRFTNPWKTLRISSGSTPSLLAAFWHCFKFGPFVKYSTLNLQNSCNTWQQNHLNYHQKLPGNKLMKLISFIFWNHFENIAPDLILY